VVQVIRPANKAAVVRIAVDKAMAKIVRCVSVGETVASPAPAVSGADGETDADGIVCRCSDISVRDIRALIARGHTTIDDLKRVARLGMGPCQGRTCVPLAARELSRALGKPAGEVWPGTFRPMVKGVKLGDVARYDGEGGA